MTIDFSQKFIDPLNGKPMTEGGTDLTLRIVAYALVSRPDEKATLAEKCERARIAFMIANATGALDLSPEDVAEIKKRIGDHPSPIIVGAAYQMLNG